MNKPIIDPSSLSEEQRDAIRKEYNKSYNEAFAHTTCLDRQYARGRYQVLREIFGSKFFNQKGE